MKKILYSLNPQEYPNIEMDFIVTTAVDSLQFTSPEVINAQKTVPVHAVQAQADVEVVTRPRVEVEGKLYYIEETKNVAHAGDWIVTNPDGEQYVVSAAKFPAKYSDIGNGQFVPTEGPKTFQQTTENVCFQASWGATQFVTAGSYICTAYGPGEEYGVSNFAFNKTYEIQTPTM